MSVLIFCLFWEMILGMGLLPSGLVSNTSNQAAEKFGVN